MKKLISLISILLILAMLLPACNLAEGDGGTGAGDKDGSQGSAETGADEPAPDMPEIDKKNYNDEFYLHILPDVNPTQFYWVEESKNDILSDAIYERQEKVRQHIGVEVIGIPTGDYSKYLAPFKNSVKNKDGSVDALISHVANDINGLISENYLTDLKDVPGIDLEADYWNQEFMDSISIADHNFLGFSDFNILFTHVIAFNKTLMEQYGGGLEETVYEMVDNYRWTLDKWMSIAQLAYIDKTNDGKSEDDQFGITGYQFISFVGFLHASNINLVEQDDSGDYTLAVYNEVNREKTVALVDKLKEMVVSDYSWFTDNTNRATKKGVSLSSGRALFNLSTTYNLVDLVKTEVSFGVLPYPMWDESQKDVGYRSLQWGGYICAPSYLRNPALTGESLELLSFYSDRVTEAFYQKLLGKQVAESPDDNRMLGIVWDSVCSDFGQTYSSVAKTASPLYMIPELTYESSNKNIASYIASIEKTANTAFKKYIKGVSKQFD